MARVVDVCHDVRSVEGFDEGDDSGDSFVKFVVS